MDSSQYRTVTSDLANDDADFRDPSELPPEPVTEINSKSRVLQVELSDGEITVIGTVTDAVPGLNSSTVPGTKILLIPCVLCRRRCIRLTALNCEVLGGCSESLMEKNWPSLRVLCQMLRIDYTMVMQKAS
ncbi:hypothetical protein FO519_010843 [Halicephalobus sp. NKZ332]|nr:hypothetical protein FO519_010843 [Halicephalobus sp. NKZ332]